MLLNLALLDRKSQRAQDQSTLHLRPCAPANFFFEGESYYGAVKVDSTENKIYIIVIIIYCTSSSVHNDNSSTLSDGHIHWDFTIIILALLGGGMM